MDKYHVEKRIGSGSYGSAYLVRLRKDRRAIYVLKKIRIDNVSAKERAAAHQEVSGVPSWLFTGVVVLGHKLMAGMDVSWNR